MSTPKWAPGTQYPMGSLVVPRSNSIVTVDQPYNNSFESGMTHWTVSGQFCTNSTAQAAVSATTAQSYDGTQSATFAPTGGNGDAGDPRSGSGNYASMAILTNNYMAPVVPGQVIQFGCYMYCQYGDPNQSWCSGGPRIGWYDASNVLLGYSVATAFGPKTPTPTTKIASAVVIGSKLDLGYDVFTALFGGGSTKIGATINSGGPGMFGDGQGSNEAWTQVWGYGVAPKNAAYAAAVIAMSSTAYAGQYIYADEYTWNYTSQGYPTGLVFEAIQASTKTSGTVEPVWPTIAGNTVYDPNTAGVEWEAAYASSITWTTSSILTSGATAPTWPTVIGAAVKDNNIEWTATDGRITDPNCPSNSKVVAIASAKVYAADNDIIRFSATANAQDWTSSQDAGFIPFGLNDYGNEPCEGLGLYRSNLCAFNSIGYQMWQVDPDPNNIAILDAEPVGCDYPKSIQPVNNDLIFLSPVGIRNIGTAGSAGNLQAGQFGKQVDPLVKGLIKLANANGYEVKSLFYPGTGQYWMLIGPFAMVLSINGNNTMSWSRYEFPATITDWTISDGVLYLRAGELVWEMSDEVVNDDVMQTTAEGGTDTGYDGYMAWNYLACGQEGVEKDMEGFDLTIGTLDDDGEMTDQPCTCEVSIGYNQSDKAMATEPYEVDGDSIPGTMIPMPMSSQSFQLRLDFGQGQNWGWAFANLYMLPVSKP